MDGADDDEDDSCDEDEEDMDVARALVARRSSHDLNVQSVYDMKDFVSNRQRGSGGGSPSRARSDVVEGKTIRL